MGLGYGRYILVRVLLLGGIVQYSTVQYSSTVQVRTKVCSVCMVVNLDIDDPHLNCVVSAQRRKPGTK